MALKTTGITKSGMGYCRTHFTPDSPSQLTYRDFHSQLALTLSFPLPPSPGLPLPLILSLSLISNSDCMQILAGQYADIYHRSKVLFQNVNFIQPCLFLWCYLLSRLIAVHKPALTANSKMKRVVSLFIVLGKFWGRSISGSRQIYSFYNFRYPLQNIPFLKI